MIVCSPSDQYFHRSHGGGYEENPNNFKLRDSKDNAVLCFRCGKSAMGKGGFPTREVVACDFCACSWHLDCLDPPLASAPNRKSTNGKPRHTWMCPAHVDEELLYLDPSYRTSSNASKYIRPPTSRSYRVRRPKHPKIIDIGLRRGFRNNGFIEIEMNQVMRRTKYTRSCRVAEYGPRREASSLISLIVSIGKPISSINSRTSTDS